MSASPHSNNNFWPTARHYAEAVQCPPICFEEPALKASLPAVDRLGMPLVTSGQFAYVFKLNAPHAGGETLAVRCFRGYLGDREARYTALDAHLRAHRINALPRFRYLPKGILVAGGRYPLLVMEWIEGATLDVYLDEVIGRPDVLRHLADEWLRLMAELRAGQIAHGDLQHGNIIVERGQLRLVDLDGMYVHALAGHTSSEVGHQHYQHPQRDAHFFSLDVDNFSALVVYLSLISLAARPSLWREHHDENLIFTKADFLAPDSSALFQQVREVGAEQRALADALADAAKADPHRTPWLLDLVSAKSKLPGWINAPADLEVHAPRTREVARAQALPVEAATQRQWSSSTATQQQQRVRPATSTTASGSVQTLFNSQPAASTRGGVKILDPLDVHRNTFKFAKGLMSQTYFFFWIISPLHRMVAAIFGVGSGTGLMLTFILLFVSYFLYGYLRAIEEARKYKSANPPPPLPLSADTSSPSTHFPHAPASLFGSTTSTPTTSAPSLFSSYTSPVSAFNIHAVVGNQSLMIYHQPDCSWVDKISSRHRANFNTPASAQAAGYRACHVCAP